MSASESDSTQTNSPSSSSDHPRRGRRTGSLLLIDDDADQRLIFSAMLSGAGYTVHAVAEAVHALELLTRERVDCIICDIMMPGMSGPEFVERARAVNELEYTPIIMFSAARDDLETELLQIGADTFCSKRDAKTSLLQQLKILLS